MDHGIEGKSSLYEAGIRIAQFVHYPDKINPNRSFDGMVTTADVAPTILDYAGVPTSSIDGMDGVTWKPQIEANLQDWSEPICQVLEMELDRAVRCGCYKYISNFNATTLQLQPGVFLSSLNVHDVWTTTRKSNPRSENSFLATFNSLPLQNGSP